MATAEQEVMKIERKQTPGFWAKWAGKEIVIQTKGRVIIMGIFRESRDGFVNSGQADDQGREEERPTNRGYGGSASDRPLSRSLSS